MTQETNNLPGRKPTIGLVINTIEHTARHINGQKTWLGVMAAAKTHDVNLLCFHVDFMSKQPPYDTAKILYELIDSQNVDGLIFSLYWDREKFDRYCSRFSASLPIVNIRRRFAGFPVIIQNDYQGMWDAITHLVAEHGFQRIAYIRGDETNVNVQERYRSYQNALAEHDIPFNEKLVTPWMTAMGEEAGSESLRVLIDDRNLRPGIDFDAIAVNNDRMAYGVLKSLEERGVRVPYDVAVIAFDGLAGAEFTNPPLTTMDIPHYQMGKQAAETLFALIEGANDVLDFVQVPTKMALRQSCGCLPFDVKQAAVGKTSAPQTEFATTLGAQREDIVADMAVAAGNEMVAAWAERVLAAFVDDIEMENGRSHKFLERLDEALRPMVAEGDDVFAWQAALSAMRTHLRPGLSNHLSLLADDLWQQATVLIGKTAYQSQKYQVLQTSEQAELLRRISAEFVTLFEIDALMDRLAEDLPQLGIRSTYISLYDDPEVPEDTARLILANTKHGRLFQNEGVSFPSRQLLPDNLLAQDQQTNYVIESLHFRDKPIGYAIFEASPLDGNLYAILGKEISRALQGVLLVEQVNRRAAHLQASVEVTEAVSREELDPKELVQQVVDLIRDRFNLYYVGLFLVIDGSRLDPNPKKYALLQAGTGEAGQQMVAKGHKLDVGGNSMIGQCVATGEPCIAQDVGEATKHFSNPLLPDTRSELALPLISRGETIGALGLQSDRKSAFDREAAAILQTMAGQLASAIENARLFSQAEETMNRLQSELKKQVRDGWNRYFG